MKRYIKPEIEIIDMETEMILAGSDGGDSLKDKVPGVDNPDNVFAKGHTFSVWADEEDGE